MAEDVKQAIRRRLYAARVAARQPLGELADHFERCPACQGRGQVGYAIFHADGAAEEVDTACPMCAGDGFVPRDQQPNRT